MPPEFVGPAHDGSGVNEPDRVPAIERMHDDVAGRMMALGKELQRQRALLADLLRHVGRRGICKGPNCKQPILYVWHVDAGAYRPYNEDGIVHYATCIDRELFHGKRRSDNATRDAR